MAGLNLFHAVRRGDLRAVEDLLDRRPDLADAQEAEVPALVVAAERADLPIVRTLLARGADVDRGRPGALWVAVAARYPDVARCLLAAGADVRAVGPGGGQAPLHVAA